MLPSAVNVARPEIAIGIGAEVGVKLICQDPAKDGSLLPLLQGFGERASAVEPPPNASSFPPGDPLRGWSANGQRLFAPACSAPPSIALRPRVVRVRR